MRSLIWGGGGVVALALFPVSRKSADSGTFTATLLGPEEVPANGSPVTGSATVILDTTALTPHRQRNLLGPQQPRKSSVHPCYAPAGVNTAVALFFPAFPNATGTYSPTINLGPSSSCSPAFFTG
jgi:hypothetical protein